MIFWLVLAAVVVALYFWQRTSKPPASRAPKTPPAPAGEDCGEGAPPVPEPHAIDGPNVRIVDLRTLPEEDVRVGRFGVTAAVIDARPPVACQLFVVSPETAAAWLAMSDVALTLVLGRLRRMRTVAGGRAMLHVADEATSPEAEKRFATCGLEIARDLAVVGSERTVTLAEALALPRPAPSKLPPRPVLPYTLHSLGLVGQGVVFEIDRAVFVDLRRASPASLTNLAVLDHVDKALGALRRGSGPDRLIIWCTAPWVFDCWRGREDEVVGRFEAWTKRLPGPRHRLAVFDPTGDEPMIGRLAALGLRALAEKLEMKVEGTCLPPQHWWTGPRSVGVAGLAVGPAGSVAFSGEFHQRGRAACRASG